MNDHYRARPFHKIEFGESAAIGMTQFDSSDEAYLALILDALAVCRTYRPKFGKGSKAGFTLAEFQELYQQYPFNAWFGLDSPPVYAAHKAAGGITSVYRQIGIACERLFHQVLRDTLRLDPAQASWHYTVPGAGGRIRSLSLDGRISIDDIRDPQRLAIIREWLQEAAMRVRVDQKTAAALRGSVFEAPGL